MKRENRLLRLPALVLSAVLLCLSSACAGQETPQPAQTDGTAAQTEESMKDYLVREGKSGYSVQADKRVSLIHQSDIERMQKGFAQVYGTELQGGEHKLLLAYEGDRGTYRIAYDGETGSVTLSGGDEESLRQAIAAFSARALDGLPGDSCAVDGSWNLEYDKEKDATDNASLLRYIPTDEVRLVSGNASGTLRTPEWAEGLVMTELRPEMASIGGTLPACGPLLDFYASVGVNGLWLCPIYRRDGGNGYGNAGAHLFEPAITGTEDQTEAIRVIRDFVSRAHEKGIYIFFDVITWGVVHGSELEREHPDWFEGEAWGGAAFQWKNEALREWFVSTCVRNILETDADGFRCDCEPFTSGYDVYGEIRERLAKQGKYVVIISEDGSDRSRTYDFEQDGVLKYSAMTRGEYYQKPVNFFADGLLDLVDSVKNGTGLGAADAQKDSAVRGTGKYYTNCITNHDFEARNVKGNRLKIGYAAILAPFIPLWYMGDEFNASCPAGVQYFQKVNYAEAEKSANLYFFEDVKRYIRIRRSFPDLFEVWAENHRDSNICAVTVTGGAKIGAYARYAQDRAALVIPADYSSDAVQTVEIPFDACGLDVGASYVLTDLMTGRVLADGKGEELQTFYAAVPPSGIGVYLIEKK